VSNFTVVICARDRNPHAACFEEVAVALKDSLLRLGHEIFKGTVGDPTLDYGRMIMFGVNNGEWLVDVPKDAIIFNSEQISAVDDPERYVQNHKLYRDHVVWDYSATNLETLRQLGIQRAVHCPIGYIDTMTTIAPVEEDIDVLFYGSTNPHRLKILDGLDAAGLKVKRLFGVYGKERDAWIARSKVVLNLHHYHRGVFEIFRVSHLVANNKCVVSEDGGVDQQLNEQARRLTWSVPYDDIIDACRGLVFDPALRATAAERGMRAFSESQFTDHVARALEQS
jgi:hypothetical protein